MLTQSQWATMTLAERSRAIGDALKDVEWTDKGPDFVGLSQLFGLWGCYLHVVPCATGCIWYAGLGLRVLSMPTRGNEPESSKDAVAAAVLPLLKTALDAVRDGLCDPWSKDRRAEALADALRGS